MGYNYEELYSLYNLQRQELERVLAEAQQALESLEFKRHLLLQHRRLSLRLAEVSTQLTLVAGQLEDLKFNRRITPSARPPDKSGPGDRHASSPGVFFTEDQASRDFEVARPGNSTGNGHSRAFSQAREDTNTQAAGLTANLQELELVDLRSYQQDLERQKKQLEGGLARLEQQLTALGIGVW